MSGGPRLTNKTNLDRVGTTKGARTMKIAYFDYAGTPVRLILDADELPERCEVFDRAAGTFAVRDDLTVDIWSSHAARLIDKEEFDTLLARARNARSAEAK